jgi:hypothetical protein
MGSFSEPGAPICQKWSITQIESNPASSAERTTLPKVGPIAAAPPGQVNE